METKEELLRVTLFHDGIGAVTKTHHLLGLKKSLTCLEPISSSVMGRVSFYPSLH
jgi:hypothetical protein